MSVRQIQGLTVLVSLAVLVSNCGSGSGESIVPTDGGAASGAMTVEEILGSSATYADSLDLSSPERAVEVFSEAFGRSDFLTVYLVLDRPERVIRFYQFRDFESLLHPDAVDALMEIPLLSGGIGTGEHLETSWYLFDEVMMVGARESGFLLDLRGRVTVGTVTDGPVGSDGDATRVVEAEVEGIDGVVEFWVAESPSGRWRVRQVVAPGAVSEDDSDIWVTTAGAPASSTAGNEPPEAGRTFYEILDLSGPERALDTFLAAFRRSDFPTVFLILDRTAQRELDAQRAFFRFERFLGDAESVQDLVSNLPGLGELEPDATIWGGFSELMEIAETHSAFLIDLRGEVAVSGTADGPLSPDGRETIDVLASVEGIDGTTVFRMVQAPSGRWRVLQVVVPGGDEDLLPWSITSR